MRSAILLLCIFTATTADISLISLGTKNAADDGYVYDRPSIPFGLPPKEVIIKPNPGPPASVIAVTPRPKYNYPTPSIPFKLNEIPNSPKAVRIIQDEPVVITPRPVPTARITNFAKTTYDYPTPSIPFEKSSEGYRYDAPKNKFGDESNKFDVVTAPTVIKVTPRKPVPSKGYDYPPPQPQLNYPNKQEENRNVPQQVKIPVSTRPTTTTAKPVQSSYLPPAVPVTTTIRPTTARSIITPKDGYSYDKPIVPFESATNKVKAVPTTARPITTPIPVQSSYLPPAVPVTTTVRPTTPRSVITPKDGYSYDKPIVPFESATNKVKAVPPTARPITTPRPVQSSYLPPAVPVTTTVRPTTARSVITPKDGYSYDKPIVPFESATNKVKADPPTARPITTPRPVQSSYLPPAVPVTTTIRPTTARSIITPKDGYSYDKPIVPFESATNKVKADPPTARPITTPRPVQSSYLPPAVPVTTTVRPTTPRSIITPKDGYSYDKPIVPFESATNKVKAVPPTARPITTPRPVQSSYLPPAVPVTTTVRPTTPRSVITPKDGYSYDKPIIPFESATNKVKAVPPTARPITTPRPVQSSYLPPAVPVTTTVRPTTPRSVITPKDGYSYDKPIVPFESATNKVKAVPPTARPITTPTPVQSSYLPPAVPVTTTIRPTTARSIITPKDGYSYDKPIVPFESATNKVKAVPPSAKPITTPKPVYLPPKAPTTATTRRPLPTSSIVLSTIKPRGGYKYEKPEPPFNSVNDILRNVQPKEKSAASSVLTKNIVTSKPNPTRILPAVKLQSTYLPPSDNLITNRPTTTRPTTTRPATTRPATTRPTTKRPTEASTRFVASTYLPPNEIPNQSKTNLKTQTPVTRLVTAPTTPRSVPSTYLPPNENPTTKQQTTRTTTTTRASAKPTPKSVPSTYLPPLSDKPTTRQQLTTRLTTTRPTTKPTLKYIASTYLPPTNEKVPEQSKTNINTQKPTTRFTTVRTTPKSVPSTYLPPSSDKPTTRQQLTTRLTTTRPTTKPTLKPVASTYLPPPNEKVPEQSKTNINTQKPTTKFTTVRTTPKSVPSTYLPPSTDKPTTRQQLTTRLTTTRPTTKPTLRSVASTYLPPPNVRVPEQSKTNINTQKPTTRLTTVRTTPKAVPSTYLPPLSDKPTTRQQLTTRLTTTRPTTKPTLKYIASTYLPPTNEKVPEQSKTNINTQKPTTRFTTVRTTPKSVPSTYLPPSSDKPTTRQQLTTRLTTTRPTTKPTLKPVASTYLPPPKEKVPEQSKTNINTQKPTTRFTTVRTTPKSVPSTYLPPLSDKPTTRQPLTTRLTTTRPATKPTLRSVASTYLPPPKEKVPEQSKTNINTQKPTTRLTTVRTTPKAVPSTYLPPLSDKPTTRQQLTTRLTTTRPTTKPTLKSVASTYLPPPNEKPDQSKTDLKLQKPTTTTVRTTSKPVVVTYLPPKDGYDYPKPAIPFNF